QPPHTTCRRSGLPAGPCLPRPRRDPGDASFEGRNRPSSCAYHLVHRTETNHWSSRGGMTCTSMTKQSNDQALTDCPGDPNVWYIQLLYPYIRSGNPTRPTNSDSEDDSTRSSQPIGRDGWHD